MTWLNRGARAFVSQLFSWIHLVFKGIEQTLVDRQIMALQYVEQGLSQDLETGCPKLTKILGRPKADHNILRF